MSGTWGEFLRLRGRLHAAAGRADRGVPRLRPERQRVRSARREAIRPGLSYLELGRLAAAAGARSRATRYLTDAAAIFEALGAAPDLADARAALDARAAAGTGGVSSASRWTATTRSCGGSWMPR